MAEADASIALTAAAIAVTVISRRQFMRPETLKAVVEQQERVRAREAFDQVAHIRALSGPSAVIATAASQHARDAWDAATWVAQGKP